MKESKLKKLQREHEDMRDFIRTVAHQRTHTECVAMFPCSVLVADIMCVGYQGRNVAEARQLLTTIPKAS